MTKLIDDAKATEAAVFLGVAQITLRRWAARWHADTEYTFRRHR